MAFPTIPTTGAGTIVGTLQANTTATRTFPAFSGLTYSAGDLLLAIAIGYQSSAAAGAVWSGWNNGFTENKDVGGGTSSMSIGVASKVATGAETGSLTVTQAATITGFAVLILMAISGGGPTAPETSSLATGTTTIADPGDVTPTWATDDNLWISVAGWGETSTTGTFLDATASPTNYGSDFIVASSGTKSIGNTGGGVGFFQNTAGTENASTWVGVDTSNARNAALVIAVRPAPPAPTPPELVLAPQRAIVPTGSRVGRSTSM